MSQVGYKPKHLNAGSARSIVLYPTLKTVARRWLRWLVLSTLCLPITHLL